MKVSNLIKFILLMVMVIKHAITLTFSATDFVHATHDIKWLSDLIIFSYLSYQDLFPTYPLHIDTSTLLLFYYAYRLSCQSFVELWWLFPKKYFLVHMYALFPMSFLEIVKHPWITVQKLSLYTLHGNHRGKTCIL